MSSYPRTRRRSYGQRPGGKKVTTYKSSKPTFVQGIDHVRQSGFCVDTVNSMPYPDKPLHIYTMKGHPLIVNGGRNISKTTREEYENFNPVAYADDGPSVHVSGAIPSLALLQTKIWSHGNPAGNPSVDVLNFMYEMKDFPSMLRHAGNLLSKGGAANLASTPISIQFGWKPLLNDLRSLLGAAEAIQQRLTKLRTAGDSKSRYVYLGTYNATAVGLNSFGGVSYIRSRATETKCWGVYKMKLINSRVPAYTWNDAAAIAYSTDLSAATIWNSFPWTWLIDYMFNVGTFLESTRGDIPYTIEHACIMVNPITEVSYEGVPRAGLEFNNGSRTCESKYRYVVIKPKASVTFEPGITGKQLGNLGALGLALAFGKGKRPGRK